ncbi:MAG TPA: ATP-binding cassette domain-containing protein [Longimicrobiaceae bacterium]|nr:ATP-binding cassette domain-containing protein [Longimicrobiaceae bacterium]
MDPVLILESVGRSFGGRRVLASAFLWAKPGRVTGLVGRNGAGKSTLLRIACGLVAADHGTVRFRGVVYERPRLHRLAREGLFFLPADRPLLSPSFTVGAQLRAVDRQFGPRRFDETVDRLALEAHLDADPRSLSGGEHARAELALAMLRRPVCLLADEPFRGIAPLDAERVAAVLRALAAEGCAVVLTGHELGSVFEVAEEVLWVESGTTRVMGSPEEARTHWEFRRDFLGEVPRREPRG